MSDAVEIFDGAEIAQTLERLEVSHVVWIPDSTTGKWETAFEASGGLRLLRVCREGEAWALAAGLLLGGQSPIVIMQSTGFFESGDALRNVVFDLQLPVFAIIGARNWLIADSRDSAKRFTMPILGAWGIDHVVIESRSDQHKLEEHYTLMQQRHQAGCVLLAEGKG